MVSQQFVIVNPQSPEAILIVLKEHLEQYGPINLIVTTFMLTTLLMYFFPKLSGQLTWCYVLCVLIDVSTRFILNYYDIMYPYPQFNFADFNQKF